MPFTCWLNIVNDYAHAGQMIAQQESDAAQDAGTSGCNVDSAIFVAR